MTFQNYMFPPQTSLGADPVATGEISLEGYLPITGSTAAAVQAATNAASALGYWVVFPARTLDIDTTITIPAAGVMWKGVKGKSKLRPGSALPWNTWLVRSNVISGAYGVYENGPVHMRDIIFDGNNRNIDAFDSVTVAITGISKAASAHITYAAQGGLLNGMRVGVSAVSGMTQINGLFGEIANASATGCDLTGIDSTAFSTWTSGGTLTVAAASPLRPLVELRKVDGFSFIGCPFTNHRYQGLAIGGCQNGTIASSEFSLLGKKVLAPAEGGAAIWIAACPILETTGYTRSRNIDVCFNRFHDCRWSGIYNFADTSKVLFNDFLRMKEADGYGYPASYDNTPRNHIWSGNSISVVTKNTLQGAGISMAGNNIRIVDNPLIELCDDAGIDIADAWRGVTVCHNGLKNNMLDTATFPNRGQLYVRSNSAGDAITAITKANPAHITAPGMGYVIGARVQILISPLAGMTQISGLSGVVANPNYLTGEFDLTGIDSTAFSTYTTGGTASLIPENALICENTIIENADNPYALPHAPAGLHFDQQTGAEIFTHILAQGNILYNSGVVPLKIDDGGANCTAKLGSDVFIRGNPGTTFEWGVKQSYLGYKYTDTLNALDTVENVLATIAIKAGQPGANGVIRGFADISAPANTNAKTVRVRLNGSGGTLLASLVLNTASQQFGRLEFIIANRNSPSAQTGQPQNFAGIGTVNAVNTTAVIDTSSDVNLCITAQAAVGPDQITINKYEVQLFRPDIV